MKRIAEGTRQGDFTEVRCIIKTHIHKNHAELLKWMSEMPYYYKTDKRSFVHVGIDEDAGEWWKIGTTEETFVWKFPEATGAFYKDIIAGHLSVSRLAEDKTYHDIYHDGESHYYIDGSVQFSGKVLVMRYDTEAGIYNKVPV